MSVFLDAPAHLTPVIDAAVEHLAKVRGVFDAQLRSDLPPVERLVGHVEAYRGKMLRPTVALLAGMACHPRAGAATWDAAGAGSLLGREHHVVAAVCEMVHMATLVHDDVLDEAEVRRRGRTVNGLYGNEAAVILGDYLIASAFHLCSTLPTNRAALAIGRASMTLCAGELLQLHHREDYSLDEATYLEILDRKTAELIAVAAELGAAASGASDEQCSAIADFGRLLGVAFQIQDDLLDLTGEEAVVGKSVRKDLEKGKLTLPLIHHLRVADAPRRTATIRALETEGVRGAREIRAALEETASIAHARDAATRLVDQARGRLSLLPATPAREVLDTMAMAVVERSS